MAVTNVSRSWSGKNATTHGALIYTVAQSTMTSLIEVALGAVSTATRWISQSQQIFSATKNMISFESC